MTPDEFRRHGHEVVDWVADYWSNLEHQRVTPDVRPGDIAALLPDKPPEAGEEFAAMLADLDRVVTPGLTHWQHPAYYAYFPANTSGPSVLGDLLCAGLGVQGMLWSTSPACTEVETVVLDWLAELLGLPERFRSTSTGGGVIQDSASSATLVATLAALHRASGGAWRTNGVNAASAASAANGPNPNNSPNPANGPTTTNGTTARYTVYTSTQGHSSIEKAARLAGLGDAAVRLIDVDDNYAMRPGALRAALEADRAVGETPALVVATIGTTSTTAIDPLPEIGEICREYGVWLHVDAAYAGSAAVCPELRWTHAGVEFADSYCFDPHKWLLTGFDCDAFWVADRAELIHALTVLPEYLRNAATESGAVIDYRDWQVPLGRRFRALKLWLVLRWYGAEGLRAHVRSGVALAQRFAEWVRADDRFEVVTPHPFSLVCFRTRQGDNEELLRRINATGRTYLTHTKLGNDYTLRLAIGSPQTEERHVAATWKLIQAAADEIQQT
jgi:aromatic-L-amino-acid decarboxylase